MARRRISTWQLATAVATALQGLLCGCTASASADAAGDGGAIVVSPRGDDDATGTATAPFRTLKRALATAMPGSTIRLENGTYDAANGEVWDYQTRDITLEGESTASTILSGPVLGEAGFSARALRAGGNLQLRGLSLVGFDLALVVESPATVEIADASVRGGVFVSDPSSSLSIAGSTLEGNALNAAVNFAGSKLDITGSQIHAGAAPYAVSLRAGSLSLSASNVDGGNYGVYQLAGASTLRQAQVSDYSSIGLYFASGVVDLGSAIEAGDNAFVGRAGSDSFGVYVDGTAPVTCSNTSFDGVVPAAGTVQAGATEIAEPGRYFITPGQSMLFFDAPELTR